MPLPEGFFGSPAALEAMEDLPHGLLRIKDGPLKDDLYVWHLGSASPTFGLILAGESKIEPGKWFYIHDDGRPHEFGDDEACYPKIYKKMTTLTKKQMAVNDIEWMGRDNVPEDVVFEPLVWSHEDTPANPATERYSELRRQFPGSPRR